MDDVSDAGAETLGVLEALAERVREACVRAALAGYEEAGLSGLCTEGRWEAAVDAMRRVDLRALVTEHRAR